LNLKRELLTLKLLRGDSDSESSDQVMSDFAEYVLPNPLRVAIGVTAKGGKFFDELDRKKNEAEGPEFDETTPPIVSIRICSMDCFQQT